MFIGSKTPHTGRPPWSRTDSRPMNSCFNPKKQNFNSLKIFRHRIPESAKMDLRKTISQWGEEPRSQGSFSLAVRCGRFSTCWLLPLCI